MIKDWEKVEDGLITGIVSLGEHNIASQRAYFETGLDWEEETQILIG